MDLTTALDLGRDVLLTALILCAPVLIVGMVVGLVISILQAVTQLQEQTISFVPKIAAMVAAAVFLLPWLAHRTLEYATELWGHSGVTP